MNDNLDRLYELLPVVYRLRDADQGYPLRALLQVIAEQVNLVEEDIENLYENWFIETCKEWVVPYIGTLLGYQPLQDTSDSGDVAAVRGQARNRILISRSEVANTIHYRRRKGTLRLLEDLAIAVAAWPARAVEFYRLLGVTQNINYPHLERGRTADLRDGDALYNLNGAFDELGRTVDVRQMVSRHFPGTGNIPGLGLFVWRLRPYSVTKTPAYCFEEQSPNCYLFSVLGNDTPLFTNPQPASGPPGDLNLPLPISRRSFETREIAEASGKTTSGVPFYYGENKSMQIWVGTPPQPIPADQIVPADLSGWIHRPLPGQVAVDPQLGRIVFPPGQARRQGVWVSYYYGFSADIGGGEYDRPQSQPADAKVYRVGEHEQSARINDAMAKWRNDKPQNAVIEITDSGVYVEPIEISLSPGQTLQLRAANRKRPVIRLLDWQTSAPDNLTITGQSQSWFILDGLLVTGRGIEVRGDVSGVTIRNSTLVPGWGLHCDCEPKRPTEASLLLNGSPDCITIEHSIVGGIQVQRDQAADDPVRIRVSDSIVDASGTERVALGQPESLCAYSVLSIVRSTVFGQLQSHAIELAENNILMGAVRVCRRQRGCMRFCYVTPGSRTPRRYECQPDLVVQAVVDLFNQNQITAQQRDALRVSEELRVEPEFNGTRYGRPAYCQLADECAVEIRQGADDESEMGVFHDLYQPQRAANLSARLSEYTPAGADAGIIFST
jgi:hypothetical protein